MIKIIKHGNRPKIDKQYKFKCDRCGCEWIADNQHIAAHVGGMGHIWISSNCPECDYVESTDICRGDENDN